MSALPDPTWQPLLEALNHLLAGPHPTLPTAAVVAAQQPATWTSDTAHRVHALLSTPENTAYLKTVGVDVLSLPKPQPALTITVDSLTPEGCVTVLSREPALPVEVTALAAAVPGSRTLPGRADLPSTTTSVPSLRTIVASTTAVITPEALTRLRQPAAPTGGVTLNDRGRVKISAAAEKSLVSELTRVPGLQWSAKDHCWYAPKTQVAAVVGIADRHDLEVSAEARQAAEAPRALFDYDGTLDGLRGVPVTEITTMDEKKAAGLADMGIRSVYDLLMHIPRRYLDRSALTPIAHLPVGKESAFIGRITRVQVEAPRRRVRFEVADDSGRVSITFFNALWQGKRFRVGDEVVVLGQVDEWVGRTRKEKQLTNPIMDPLGDETLPVIPVYPQSAKSRITTWDITTAAREAVNRLGDLVDPLPTPILQEERLLPRKEALTTVHFPEDVAAVTPARERLAFDELFRMQAALNMAKRGHAALPATEHISDGPLVTQFLQQLPFPLTSAQERAWEAVGADLRSGQPMHRLLQGDVGSGKTMLAALTLLAAVQSGRQGALMAPTEILATQLFNELTSRLEGIEHEGRALRVELLTNKVRGKRREALLADLAEGKVDILVGTHALLVDDVQFASLSVVVVDEQHRFGVEQRAKLRDKDTDGRTPDMLVMTATPIPRTAAMTVFGDLDIAVLDELPPGRTPIATSWLDEEPNLDGLALHPWDLVRSEVEQGRQAYVVCPLVTESEKLQAANATETFEALSAGALQGLRVGLVHGQQKADERAETMRAFVAGQLDVLVATTVIEVGVNVPNATVMVILDSGRFGIAQLHQLRGRVGRGQHASQCVLVGRVVTPDGRARMQALCDSSDGFYLSEVDLQLRGHGSILGTEQSGMSDLRVADLETDTALLERARERASQLMEGDAGLDRRPLLRAEIMATLGSDAMSWLSRS